MPITPSLHRPQAAGFYDNGLWRIPLPGGRHYERTSFAYAGSYRLTPDTVLPSRSVFGIKHNIEDSNALRTVVAIVRYYRERGVRRFGVESMRQHAESGAAKFFGPLTTALRREACEAVFLHPDADETHQLCLAHAGALMAFDGFRCSDLSHQSTMPVIRQRLRHAFGSVVDELLGRPLTPTVLADGFRRSALASDGDREKNYHTFCSNMWQVAHLMLSQLQLRRLAVEFSALTVRFNEMMSRTIVAQDVPVSFVGLAHMLPVALATQAESCNVERHEVICNEAARRGCMVVKRDMPGRFGPLTTEAALNVAHQFGHKATSSLLRLTSSLLQLTPALVEDALVSDPLFLDRLYYASAGTSSHNSGDGVGILNFLHLIPTTAEHEKQRVLALSERLLRSA